MGECSTGPITSHRRVAGEGDRDVDGQRAARSSDPADGQLVKSQVIITCEPLSARPKPTRVQRGFRMLAM